MRSVFVLTRLQAGGAAASTAGCVLRPFAGRPRSIAEVLFVTPVSQAA